MELESCTSHEKKKKTAEIYPKKIGFESEKLCIKSKKEEDARSEDGGKKMSCMVLTGWKEAGRWVDVHCSAPAPKLASFIGT